MRSWRPNAGLQAAYLARLRAIIEGMAEQVERSVLATYAAHPPEFAQDAGPFMSPAMVARIRQLAEGGDPTLPGSPAPIDEMLSQGLIRRLPGYLSVRYGYEPGEIVYELTDEGETVARALITPAGRLKAVLANMRARWERRFEEAAPRLAKWFSAAVSTRSTKDLQRILKDGGFTVKFKMTPVMRDVLDATIGENVGLIRTIPQKYLGEVEGLVMRSVVRGRDLGLLAAELRKRYDLTEKRAALIAGDQNNKATSAITHARQADLGIREAVWMHSHGGRVPRPCHVEFDGQTYKVTKGLYDKEEKRWVFPGELIHCRCTGRPIIPGLSA